MTAYQPCSAVVFLRLCFEYWAVGFKKYVLFLHVGGRFSLQVRLKFIPVLLLKYTQNISQERRWYKYTVLGDHAYI